jgi:hypothetical protein
MNLFLHYQIEDMVRHIMLGEGEPADAGEEDLDEESSTAGKDTGNEPEKIGRYREFLRKRNKEANEDSNRSRKSNEDDAPTSGILAELCHDSDKMSQPVSHPTLYTHGTRVDFQAVDPGLAIFNEFKDPDRQSNSYNDFFLGFLHAMEEYARQDGKDINLCLVHAGIGVHKVLIDHFDQVWLTDFSRVGIGPELSDLVCIMCHSMIDIFVLN